MPDSERLLSRDEVAERLGISGVTVGRMLRDGRLPGFHLGRLWRMREEDLNAYIREQAEEGATERRQRAARAASATKASAPAPTTASTAAKANETRGPEGRKAAGEGTEGEAAP